jgi:hypothetical protein
VAAARAVGVAAAVGVGAPGAAPAGLGVFGLEHHDADGRADEGADGGERRAPVHRRDLRDVRRVEGDGLLLGRVVVGHGAASSRRIGGIPRRTSFTPPRRRLVNEHPRVAVRKLTALGAGKGGCE